MDQAATNTKNQLKKRPACRVFFLRTRNLLRNADCVQRYYLPEEQAISKTLKTLYGQSF
jgi:hypothetical protein